MKISEVCIQRPVFAWVMTCVLILLGVVGYARLSLRLYPKMDNPYITIETSLPGAGPEVIESQITRTVEEAVAGLEGVASVSSQSSVEESKVYVEFLPNLKYDPSVEIINRLNKYEERFPDEATDPVLTKARSDDSAMMTLALTSDAVSPSELADFATRELQKDLESVSGVARVDVIGAGNYTMHIYLDPARIAAHNISVAEVKQALKRQNIEKPAGKLVGNDREFWVTTVASMQNPEEFEDMVIATKGNHLIRLKDIGRAEISADDKKTLTRYNGKPGISLGIVAQSTANPIEVSDLVKKLLPSLEERIPDGSHINVGYDTSTFIKRSINRVYKTLLEAAALVILSVVLFLKSARASLIPVVTIPVSLIGALFTMYLFGFTLNRFSLMALVLAIGLVVDDAIIVLENIYRYIERGMKPLAATIKGIREISFAVVATTLTLVAVYLPVALSTGMTGKYFTEFAVTLACSVLISGFAALTLSPMMCARLLKGHHNETTGSTNHPVPQKTLWQRIKDYIPTEEFLAWVEPHYDRLVRKTLSVRYSIFMAWLGIFVSLFAFYKFLPQELFPKEDYGTVKISGHAPSSSTRAYTERYVDKIDEILKDYPDIERRMVNITNPTFEVHITLKEKRSKTTDQLMEEFRAKMSEIIGLEIHVTASGSRSNDSGKNISFVVVGNKSHQELREYAELIKAEIFTTLPHKSVRADLRSTDAEDFILTVNRNKISSLGIEAATVAETVDALIRGQKACSFKKNNKLYDVKVEVEDEARKTPHDITNLFVRANDKENTLVPLSELVTIESRSSPLEIKHYSRMRSITFFIELSDQMSIDVGVERIRAIAKQVLPNDVRVEFIEETKKFMEESNSVYLIFLLALAFIYLILAAQFESWIDPLIIILTVPLSLAGALFTLMLIDNGSINLYSQIGFITLIGLITKHGIMMVDFANNLRDEGESVFDAIVKASRLRLRPILMTTFAMVLGSLPLALDSGEGSESYRQIGWVIVGGMSFGTLFTLFILPSIYILLTRRNRAKMQDISISLA